MWYNGEDDPEIAAAIEEERASARSRRHSPKAKKGTALPARRFPPRRSAVAPGSGAEGSGGGDPQTFARWAVAAAVTFPPRSPPPPEPAGRNVEVVAPPGAAGKVGRGGGRGAGRSAGRENVSVRGLREVRAG